MSLDFNFITERIAVGQKIDTQNFSDVLQKLGVTHVINLFSGNPEPFWIGDTLTLPQEDDGNPRSKDQVQAIITYGFRALASGGKLYIHCQWGIGRSPAACYALLRAFGLNQTESVQWIENRRPRCAAWSWQQYIPSIEAAL